MEIPTDDLIQTIVIAGSIAVSIIIGIVSGVQERINKRRKERAEQIKKQIEKVSPPETAQELEKAIENATVQRWFRGMRTSDKTEGKRNLGQILDSVSKLTMQDIMSSDPFKEWLFEVLNSANKDEAPK